MAGGNRGGLPVRHGIFFCRRGAAFHQRLAHGDHALYGALLALGLHVLIPEERLRPLQWIGLILAFCGIAVAFYEPGASIAPASGSILLGDFLGLDGGHVMGCDNRRHPDKSVPDSSGPDPVYPVAVMLLPVGPRRRAERSVLLFHVRHCLGRSAVPDPARLRFWHAALVLAADGLPCVPTGRTVVSDTRFRHCSLSASLRTEPVEFPPSPSGVCLAGIALVSGWQWFMQHIFHIQSHIKKETSS